MTRRLHIIERQVKLSFEHLVATNIKNILYSTPRARWCLSMKIEYKKSPGTGH
jgi:hypothetical protein